MDGCSYGTPEATEICISELGSDHTWEACRDLIDAQYRAPTRADDTNTYELTDDRLILRGENVEMTYVMDNP